MDFFKFFRNLKAGFKFVLHAGQLVNNCTSEAEDLPLAAKQGKVLMDLYTQLYSDIIWKYAGDCIGKADIVNIPAEWSVAMVLIIPYPNATGKAILRQEIMREWLDFAGTDDTLSC